MSEIVAEQLQIEIASEKKNPLLGRTELKLQVRHSGGPTPNRQALRVEIGRLSRTKPESVYIRKIVTDYGAGISECIASVYEKPELGAVVESEYIRKRNKGPETREKKPEEKKESGQPEAQVPPAQVPDTPKPTPPQAESKPEALKHEPADIKAGPDATQPTPAEEARPKTSRKKPAREKAPAESQPPEPKPSDTAPQSEDKKSPD